MTEEEFNTAITVVRNKYQSRVAIAKSFMTEEQWKVFRSKPFVAERNDKPRWNFGVDWTYFTRVSMAQILRILNHDYRPRVRVVQPRKGYCWYDDKAQVI
jgi:hypothetical protein